MTTYTKYFNRKGVSRLKISENIFADMKDELCDKIRMIRKLRGLTQQNMADFIGVSDNTYSRMEQ